MFSASGSNKAFVEPVPTAQRSRQLPLSVEIKQLGGDAGTVLNRRMSRELAHQAGNRAAGNNAIPDGDRLLGYRQTPGHGELFEIGEERPQSWEDHEGRSSKPFVVHREDLFDSSAVAGEQGNKPIRETYAMKMRHER